MALVSCSHWPAGDTHLHGTHSRDYERMGEDNSFKESGYEWEKRNRPVGRGECRDRERLLKMGYNTVCFQVDEKKIQ